MPRAANLKRFLRYNMVGLLGLGLKFSVLAALVELANFRYVLATVIAVEATILHNFSWHTFWTWGDRSAGISFGQVLTRLLRFQGCNGAVGLLVNVLVVRSLVGNLGLHYFVANVAATLIAGLASFLLSEFFVFTAVRPQDFPVPEAGAGPRHTSLRNAFQVQGPVRALNSQRYHWGTAQSSAACHSSRGPFLPSLNRF